MRLILTSLANLLYKEEGGYQIDPDDGVDDAIMATGMVWVWVEDPLRAYG